MARTMKDSGIQWIGMIPSGWEICRIKDRFSVVAGATPKSDNPLFWDGGIPWVTPADYKTRDKYVSSGRKSLTDEGYASCGTTLVPEHSIVFSKRAPVGSVALASTELCTNQGCLACVPKPRTDSLFFYYAMSVFTEQFELLSGGTTFKEIAANTFSNFKLPLPSYEDQVKISNYLDKKCVRIDGVIEKTRASIEEYKKLKQSVITQAVTKGIRPDREMKDSGIEWIGSIPNEWKVSRHKYVMHKAKEICEQYNGEDIISLTMNGVIIRDLNAGGKMPTTFDGYQYVEPEDLLLCLFDIDVTPRCVGLVKNAGLTSPAYSRFIVHDGYFNAYYDYLLRAIDDKKVFVHLSKNLRSSLTETDFGALPTIVPSYKEQLEIVEYLNNVTAEIDLLVRKKEKFLVEVESYKKAIIFEYVTGKKEVPA